jgi:hypothetical protein
MSSQQVVKESGDNSKEGFNYVTLLLLLQVRKRVLITNKKKKKQMGTSRQKSALDRLELQLKSGKKPVKGNIYDKEPLTAKDISRINKEITSLKKALV